MSPAISNLLNLSKRRAGLAAADTCLTLQSSPSPAARPGHSPCRPSAGAPCSPTARHPPEQLPGRGGCQSPGRVLPTRVPGVLRAAAGLCVCGGHWVSVRGADVPRALHHRVRARAGAGACLAGVCELQGSPAPVRWGARGFPSQSPHWVQIPPPRAAQVVFCSGTAR